MSLTPRARATARHTIPANPPRGRALTLAGLLAALLTGGAAATGTGDSEATLADCDGPHERVLQPAMPLPAAWSEARAAWLDGRQLRWAGVPTEGRFRLHHSAPGLLTAAPGARVAKSDGALTLQVQAPVPQRAGAAPDDVQRFSHIGAGPTLAVRPSDLPRLATLARSQVLLTREDVFGRVLDATHVQWPGLLDSLYAAAAPGLEAAAAAEDGARAAADALAKAPPLGAWRAGNTTRFAVWAPTAQQARLCLYASAEGAARQLVPMRRDAATGIWQAEVEGDRQGLAYAYLVEVHMRGAGRLRNLVTDPYALALTADSRRSVVAHLDSAATQPPGWSATPRPPLRASATDLAIYELHVRDFSIGDASVSPRHRGTYLAFTETGSRGMAHLKRMAEAGMTDVHLLPVFDLATVPERGCVTPDTGKLAALAAAHPGGTQVQAQLEGTRGSDCFNWGYDPWHFTAPEGSYATDVADPMARIVEFRRMVMALHRAGLRVGMDVVYNHTTASGRDPKSVLDRIVPGYYHRLNAKGEVERSTCCDNTATEHRMMGRLMIDSAVIWARDYRIDSFRFDLMGHQPRQAMRVLQHAVDAAAGRTIHLIGEGWNFGEVANGARFVQAAQGRLQGTGIGTFSDRGRDAVRGGGCCDGGPEQVTRQGWVSGLHTAPNEAVRRLLDDPATASAAQREHGADALKRQADLVRVALAGTLRDFSFETASGQVLPASRIDYAGQGAGYATEPGEVVNYTENHDNQTLWDLLALKLPLSTPREERARVQHLANAVVAFSQGIAYFHAGQEMLRSKSMDRNSYDSGDWFNRIDWTFTDNGFGAGLPPRQDNEGSWPLMAPRLADPALKPTAAEIVWTRDAFLDLLRIRSGSTLLRLRTAQDIRERLQLLDTGPQQAGSVVGAHIDGRGYPGAGFAAMVALINADTVPRRVAAPALRGQAWQLHPVLAAPTAADRRAAQSAWDAPSATFTVPPRTAVVWVRP